MNDQVKDYYAILGVAPLASVEEIAAAYRSRASVVHPDRIDRLREPAKWDQANNMLRELNDAYHHLRDPERRKTYDQRFRSAPRDASQARSDAGKDGFQGRQNADETDSNARVHKVPSEPWHFAQLSDRLRQILLGLSRGHSGNPDRIAYRTGTLLVPLFWGLCAAGWLVSFFIVSNDWRWESGSRIKMCVANAIGAVIAAWAVRTTVSAVRSRLGCHIYFTPLYFVETFFGEVWIHRLFDMTGFDATHNYNNGSYNGTTLSFEFGPDKHKLVLKSANAVKDLVSRLEVWRGDFNRAVLTDDGAWFEARTLFGNSDFSSEAPRRRNTWYLLSAFTIGAALVGVALFALGDAFNSYFDDKKAWNEAAFVNTASGYRAYMSTHSDGRYVTEASDAVSRLYQESSGRYLAGRALGSDSGASAALVSLLDFARETGNYEVRVAFDRSDDLPSDLDSRLRRIHGVSKIIPIGDSFSVPNMRRRESNIVSEMRDAFSKVIPEDILNLSYVDGTRGLGSSSMVVEYHVRSGESLYYREADAATQESIRPYYPGLVFDWVFYVRIPGNPTEYRFELRSSPAERISYIASRTGTETISIYDAMTSSAFESFGNEIVKRFGVMSRN